MSTLQKNLLHTKLDEIEMRRDVEEGIRELDAGEGIPHEKVFKDLLPQQA